MVSGLWATVSRWSLLITLVALLMILTRPATAAGVQKVNWIPAVKGIEYAQLTLLNLDKKWGSIVAVRIDPAAVMFRIYYHPGKRETIPQWATELPGAALIINANYFHPNGHPVGMVRIGNGILNPPTDRPDSGQFQVSDETPSIGPLVTKSSTKPSKLYIESFEAFPLLVRGTQPITTYSDDTAMEKARRTVIALDDTGHILIFVTWPTEMTLPEMTHWLLTSGLSIVDALNLDGGASTQIHLISAELSQALQGDASVPVVLAAFPR
jgi:exopolysaccharide biosynthesis protein